ncbi:hypothetical protein [Wolbachia endosymbiont of Pentidionis agamae]|uniref:hypothetical protein n=1 Tax=Wolbachia endosymbiont of Pentidionis agamae TaxID=3110435 RepID=UPI002FD5673C
MFDKNKSKIPGFQEQKMHEHIDAAKNEMINSVRNEIRELLNQSNSKLKSTSQETTEEINHNLYEAKTEQLSRTNISRR